MRKFLVLFMITLFILLPAIDSHATVIESPEDAANRFLQDNSQYMFEQYDIADMQTLTLSSPERIHMLSGTKIYSKSVLPTNSDFIQTVCSDQIAYQFMVLNHHVPITVLQICWQDNRWHLLSLGHNAKAFVDFKNTFAEQYPNCDLYYIYGDFSNYIYADIGTDERIMIVDPTYIEKDFSTKEIINNINNIKFSSERQIALSGGNPDPLLIRSLLETTGNNSNIIMYYLFPIIFIIATIIFILHLKKLKNR